MNDDDLQARRRSPAWVRVMSDSQLHGLAGKLAREERFGRMTSRQSHLLDSVISELEYRVRRDLRANMRSCTCEYCISPFVEGAAEELRGPAIPLADPDGLPFDVDLEPVRPS